MPLPLFKTSLFFRKKAIIFLCAFFIAAAIIFSSCQGNQTIAAKEKQRQSFKLIIDAGHGGVDQGASTSNGIKEKNITLAIAKEIQILAPQYGIDAEMTRTSDVFMNPLQRVNFASQQNADAYISVHVNELRGYNYVSGMQVYVSNSNPKFNESCILGSAIAKCLSTDFKVFPKLEDRAKNIFVLSENTLPSVLVECGFITNPDDLQLLTDSAKTEIIAKQILTGVEEYKEHRVTQMYAVQLPHSPVNSLQSKPLVASYHLLHHKKTIRKNSKAV